MHPINRSLRALALVSGVAVWAGCADSEGPLAAPIPEAEPLQFAALTCTANVRAGSVSCADVNASGTSRDVLVGGQNRYVTLATSNIAVTAGSTAGTFDFDATVRNLIPQAMGTTDGSTLDAKGVRVFFARGPVATSGTGEVRVANGELAVFTGTEPQPYFQYNEVLAPNQTSGAKRWQLSFDPGVESFSFGVYVSAPVRYPNGWVVLDPNGMLDAGTTRSLNPVVLTAVGDTVRDVPVTLVSSDTASLKVDASGVITGVRPGNATITATAVRGDTTRLGSVAISVCAAPAVGQVVQLTNASASNVCVSAGATAGEYTLMPVNQSATSSLSMSVVGNGIGAVSGPPSPNLIPDGGSVLGLSLAAPALVRNDNFDLRLRQWERDALTSKMRDPNSRVKRGARRSGGANYSITPGVPTVGQLMTLNVASGCTGAVDNRGAMVRSVGQHVIVVADTSNPAGGFTTAQYDSIAAEFDSIAYSVDTLNFGSPTDLDENGRVVAFYTRSVNELSPPASSSVVLGYFSSRDLFAADASCPRSNAGEIFYMLVPDISGAVNSNVRTVASVRGSTVGTMGHEFQHLINAARRIYVNDASSYEEVWLNEGLSHIAEELMFYRTAPGLTPRQNINLAAITSGPNASRRVAAFNTYANQNFGRLRPWLQRPDTAGAFKTNDGLATRGAIWGFLRYAADRRNADDTQFWKALVNSQISGLANIQQVLGATTALAWQRDFTTSMYTDDAVTGVDAIYTNPSWNYRSVYGGLGGFLLLARPLSSGTPLTLSYSRGGGTAYTRFGVAANARGVINVTSGGAVIPATGTVTLVRTK